ncbi:MAG: NAD(P)-dependent oxidoreductase [Promethearchaeota archaeon]
MKALITASITKECLEELKNLMDVTYEPWRETGIIYLDINVLAEKLDGYDIFITETDDLKKKELFEKTNLKFLVSCRGDPFNIDLNAATEKGIPVTKTPLRNVVAVAELTIAYILMLARKLQNLERVLHSDDFELIDFEDYINYINQFQGFELNGKTAGIIGLGQIGRRVADRLKAFGVSLLIYDPYVNNETIVKYGKKVDIDELMKNSDIITIHTVATDENDNLINKDRLAMMKKTAILINTSKGSLVDYDALYDALKEKQIAGAALDVFPMEPIDEDNEFLELENAIVSPHIGGDTEEVVVIQSNLLLTDIKEWLNGQIPKNILNPEVFKVKRGDHMKIKNDDNNELKNEIVKTCKKLLKDGHVIGSAGNISVRVKQDDEEFVLITPSNVKYVDMIPEDILTINMEGKVIEGERNPSVEKFLHLGVYKARDDVNAIIHSHGIYSTILSTHKMTLPPIIEELVPYVGGEIICAEYGEAGSPELAENVINSLEKKNALLLPNHGSLCCGSHLEGAYTVLEYVERGSEIYYKSKLLGDPTLLPEDTVEFEQEIFEVFKESKKI